MTKTVRGNWTRKPVTSARTITPLFSFMLPLHLPADHLRTDAQNLASAQHWQAMRALARGRGFRAFATKADPGKGRRFKRAARKAEIMATAGQPWLRTYDGTRIDGVPVQ